MTEEKQTQTCRLCGETKDINLFEIDNRQKSVRTSRCKACKTGLEDKAVRALRFLRNRAKENSRIVGVTLSEIKRLYEMFDGTCIYCGAKEQPDGPTFHLEHVIAVSEGGQDHISNLVIACPSCNARKKNKPVVSHFFNDVNFKDSSFGVLVYYLALTSGQPTQEILDDLIEAHADFQLKELFPDEPKEFEANAN